VNIQITARTSDVKNISIRSLPIGTMFVHDGKIFLKVQYFALNGVTSVSEYFVEIATGKMAYDLCVLGLPEKINQNNVLTDFSIKMEA
jgi:hypothetical protein